MNILTSSGGRLCFFLLPIFFSSCFFAGFVAAAPSFSPSDGKVPLNVQFYLPGGESCDSVTWTFEDGKIGSEINPLYTYTTMGFHYPTCVCTLPGATVSYSFDKIVSSNADMPDPDTYNQHYPSNTAVDIRPDALSLEDQIRQASGLSALGLNDYAAASYQKVIQMSGSDPAILAQYGMILAGLSRWKDSAYVLNMSLAIKPDPATYNAYGGVLTRMSQYDEALSAFNRSLELESTNPNAWAGTGQVYELMKQNDEAASAYRKSLDLDPANAPVWKGYGNVLTALGRDTEAVDAYGQAISLGMSNADTYLKYGGALRKVGRDGEAQAAMNQVRSLQGSLSSSSIDYIPLCTAGGVM
jgi:Flp pilus assembly protein TadD